MPSPNIVCEIQSYKRLSPPYEQKAWHYEKTKRIIREAITCDDRNPPGMNKKIKELVLHENHIYNVYSRERNCADLFN